MTASTAASAVAAMVSEPTTAMASEPTAAFVEREVTTEPEVAAQSSVLSAGMFHVLPPK